MNELVQDEAALKKLKVSDEESLKKAIKLQGEIKTLHENLAYLLNWSAVPIPFLKSKNFLICG